jgi:hypothetical protein
MPSVKVVVADTGPLLALARINGLEWLPALFGEVLVPTAVLTECLARPDRPEEVPIRAAVDARWLTAMPDPPADAGWGLGAGESSAIRIALARSAGLLADDRAARRVASRLAIPVIGVLGVLLLARRQGMLATLRPRIEQLVASGYFLSDAVINEALRRAGE